MAAVKEIEKSIKSHKYVHDSIAYILSPENKGGEEKCFRETCINCVNDGADGLAEQFFETRRAFNKDDKILAHHYVQSFSPNENITPELAHQIGMELAESVAPGFQFIIATHIDRDHLHTHIIINSVSMETGLKWKGDLHTRMNMRSESDRLCQKHGLTTIKNKTGLRGIDQATRELAAKGKSWKVELCKGLDDARLMCHSKEDFIRLMGVKGFEVTRYTDREITFQKVGQTKKIRISTLAEQFGDAYTKENMERMMGFYSFPKPREELPKSKPPAPFKTEFEKYEEHYFKQNPPPSNPLEAKALRLLIKNATNPLFYLLLVIMKLMVRTKYKPHIDKHYSMLHRKGQKQKRFKKSVPNVKSLVARYDKRPKNVGNITYRNLVKAQGNNFRVKLNLSTVPKLYAYPFFFSARIYGGYAIVTVKEKDKKLLQKALNVEDIQVIERHNSHYTPLAEYNELKKRAEQFGVKVEFLIIDPQELEKLTEEKARFVSIATQEGKIRLAFLPQNKDFILHALYPDKYEDRNDLFSVGRNSRVNTRLKAESLLGGKQLTYRTLSKAQVERLGQQTQGQEMFAVFGKGKQEQGQYNVAFKEEDEEKIDSILGTKRKPRR